MTFSGIHVNFSFSDELLQGSFRIHGGGSFQDYKDKLYLKLASSLAVYGWILTAVTAASPLFDSSFVEKGVCGGDVCEAAYSRGGEWYQAMMSYVKDNIAYTRQFVKEHLPGVDMAGQEATYLAWLDFRGLGLDSEELDRRIVCRAKLWLDSGRIFGECGRGFQRINVACPRGILEEALQRLEKL